MKWLLAALVAVVVAVPALAVEPVKFSLDTPYQIPGDERWWVPVMVSNPDKLNFVVVGGPQASPPFYALFGNLEFSGDLKPTVGNGVCIKGTYWNSSRTAGAINYTWPFEQNKYRYGDSGYYGPDQCGPQPEWGWVSSIPVYGEGYVRFISHRNEARDCGNALPALPSLTSDEWVRVPPDSPTGGGGGSGGHEEGVAVSTEGSPAPVPAKPRTTWGRIKSLYR